MAAACQGLQAACRVSAACLRHLELGYIKPSDLVLPRESIAAPEGRDEVQGLAWCTNFVYTTPIPSERRS